MRSGLTEDNYQPTRGPVLFLFTHPFVVRDFTSDDILEGLMDLCGRMGSGAVFSSYEEGAKPFIESLGGEFESIPRPSGFLESVAWKIQRRYVFRSNVFRHNEANAFINQARFRDITQKYGRSGHPALRGHDVWPSYLGLPFPKSKKMLRMFEWLLGNGAVNWSRPIAKIFAEHRPSALVIGGINRPIAHKYSYHARKANIPVIGFVGSWDHLTKDGPVPKQIDKTFVWNETMAEEARLYHQLDDQDIEVVGGLPFDKYVSTSGSDGEQSLVRRFDIELGQKVIAFTANTFPRGLGEPSIVRHLSKQLSNGALGDTETVIIVRSHPYVRDFEDLFKSCVDLPNVRLWKAADPRADSVPDLREDNRLMQALLKNADLLVCGQGTPAIDGACADVPVINLAFDGTAEAPAELGVRNRYEVDHYQKLLSAEGSTVVESFEALDAAVRQYREHPGIHAEGRARIRTEFAGYEDGKTAWSRTLNRLEVVLKEALPARS
jgi:hypothetical protein